jgi:creatinine amidohydrolase
MYAYPDCVHATKLDPVIAPTGPIRDAADYRRRFPDGRIGSDPSLANAKDGKSLVDACTVSLLNDFKRFCRVEIAS